MSRGLAATRKPCASNRTCSSSGAFGFTSTITGASGATESKSFHCSAGGRRTSPASTSTRETGTSRRYRTPSQTVSTVIARGFLPAALEMMDQLAIKAVNGMYQLGLPESAGAALLIELDGVNDGLDDLLAEVTGICEDYGAMEVRPAKTAEEQAQVWAARKNAFGAMGRLAPSYYLVDTVVPRTRLPATLAHVGEVAREYRLPIANVFHAGDGNLHPLILFDRRDKDQLSRALDAATDVLRASIEQGGVISGEHGIGVEKRDYMTLLFSTNDLAAMAGLKQCFDPHELFNPGKVFPAGRGCGELAALRRAGIAVADFAGTPEVTR